MRAVLAAVPLVLVVSACGGAEQGAPAEGVSPSGQGEDTVGIPVHLTTSTERAAADHDGVYCGWVGTSYVLRDAEGVIVAEGDVESSIEGDAQVGGEQAQIGTVRESDPYECAMDFRIEGVPVSDFYEIEVSTDVLPLLEGEEAAGELTAQDTFSLEEGKLPDVELEFSG